MMGLLRSSSLKPIALNIERAPARLGPSVIALLCDFALSADICSSSLGLSYADNSKSHFPPCGVSGFVETLCGSSLRPRASLSAR
jgi:hypothetical protein